MKPASEWLNEVGETVANSMLFHVPDMPPGGEVEKLIARIQADAMKSAPHQQCDLPAIRATLNKILGEPGFALTDPYFSAMADEIKSLRAKLEQAKEALLQMGDGLWGGEEFVKDFAKETLTELEKP